jgi:hypothetical protein
MACKNVVMCFTQHFLSVLFWQPQSSSWILMILQAHPGKLFLSKKTFGASVAKTLIICLDSKSCQLPVAIF